jgi:CRISPR/Cas system-associated endonuclease Cas3-HD
VDQSDFSRKAGHVVFSDFARAVIAAVVDENIFPVPISLMQHAFDALREKIVSVIERGDDADER